MNEEEKNDAGDDNPSIPESIGLQIVRRPISIDACNVGRSACHDRSKLLAEAIYNVVKYFISRGHRTIAFLPQSYAPRKSRHYLVEKPEFLKYLNDTGLLAYTPPHAYDDLFVLEWAANNGGVVVSNDKFRDVDVRQYPQLRTVVDSEKRLIPLKWTNKGFKIPARRQADLLALVDATTAAEQQLSQSDKDRLMNAFRYYDVVSGDTQFRLGLTNQQLCAVADDATIDDSGQSKRASQATQQKAQQFLVSASSTSGSGDSGTTMTEDLPLEIGEALFVNAL